MRLYTRWQNSAGERVRIAFNLKGVRYEYVPIGSLPAGSYLRINPQGLIPTLGVEGRFIAQSVAILEYLEETYPNPALLPADPVLRGQARAFGTYIAGEMHALTVSRVRKFIAQETTPGEGGVQRWTSHWLTIGFTALEATLAARTEGWPFCFGDTPGWADLHLVPQLANGRRLGLDLARFQTLLAIERNCAGLDSFIKARPDMQVDYPGAF